MHTIIRKFLSILPVWWSILAQNRQGIFGLLLTGGVLAVLVAFSLQRSTSLSGGEIEAQVGFRFPAHALSDGAVGRLQAMNVVPVQDGGLALQWHLLAWPNSWFERFPLTVDQNLQTARAVQSEEYSYWMNSERLGRRRAPSMLTCPQVNPLTPSSARIWDSAMSSPGIHLGEVWLSDTMADLSHTDLKGNLQVVESLRGSSAQPDDHGTHVAGIMAALRNGDGAVGVVPGLQVKLFPLSVKLTQEGPRISGNEVLESLDSIIVSLITQQAKQERKNRVILLSWAFFEVDGLKPEFLEALESRIHKILEHDVALVVPAGNLETGRKLTAQAVYPAAWSSKFRELPGSLLPVSALDFCSRAAWFANLTENELGSVLLAPGERIYSTLVHQDFGYMTGTSAAAAQVAAVLALTSQQYSEVDMKTQVHTLLRTAVPVASDTERLASFDAPALVQGLMAEYGWIARH